VRCSQTAACRRERAGGEVAAAASGGDATRFANPWAEGAVDRTSLKGEVEQVAHERGLPALEQNIAICSGDRSLGRRRRRRSRR
jgi:hypothetical protein